MTFYKPPAGRDPQELVEELGIRVAAAYNKVELELIAKILKRTRNGKPPRDMLERAQVIQQLRKDAEQIVNQGIPADLAAQVIATAEIHGTAAAVGMLKIARHLPHDAKLSNARAVIIPVIESELTSANADVTRRILRYPIDALGNWLPAGDAYQQIVGDVTPAVHLNSASREQARRRAVKQALERGITGFTDQAGRRWQIGSYMEMATRTAAQRAYTETTVFRLQQQGIDTGQIVIGASACQHCAQWAGKVLSTTGQVGDVQVLDVMTGEPTTIHIDGTLDDARASGWGHPNCRCAFVAWLAGTPPLRNMNRYNPTLEKARDDQRYMERQVRRYKMRAQVADSPQEAAELKKKARDVQKRIRSHVAKHNLPRKNQREQPWFATGKR